MKDWFLYLSNDPLAFEMVRKTPEGLDISHTPKDIDSIITKLEKQIGKKLVSPEKKNSNTVQKSEKPKSTKNPDIDDEIVIMEEKKPAFK